MQVAQINFTYGGKVYSNYYYIIDILETNNTMLSIPTTISTTTTTITTTTTSTTTTTATSTITTTTTNKGFVKKSALHRCPDMSQMSHHVFIFINLFWPTSRGVRVAADYESHLIRIKLCGTDPKLCAQNRSRHFHISLINIKGDVDSPKSRI